MEGNRGLYSPRIERALQKTAYLHKEQERIMDELPYVSHLFSVFLIVSRYTQDEDTLISALLHDAVEDTEYTLEELELEFGPAVASIVRGVTEEKERNGKKLPWKERKLGYLENLKKDSEESMLICVADKIHNLQALTSDYQKYGNILWDELTAGLEEKLWYHREVLTILDERLKHRQAFNDLKRVYGESHQILLGEEWSRYSATPSPFMTRTNKLIETWRFGRLSKLLRALPFRPLSARIFGYGNRNTG